MAVLGNYSGNLNQPSNTNLAGTSATDVFTATDDSTIVSSFAFANTTGGAVTCTLEWFDSRTSAYYVIWIGSVAATSTSIQSDIPIRLRTGDKIRATGAANVRITLFNMLAIQFNRPLS